MMTLKTLILSFFISLCSSTFASVPYFHPQASDNDKQSPVKNVAYPGYCDIEIINNSFEDVRVYGVFDDGSSLYPLNVYSWGPPVTISLYYYDYCHSGMDLYINSFNGLPIYAGYTERNKTIRI